MTPSETQAVVVRPIILAKLLSSLAAYRMTGPLDTPRETRRTIRRLSAALEEIDAVDCDLAELANHCANATDDDITAAIMEHREQTGLDLPWDGSIIKLILDRMPEIITLFQLIASLLAKPNRAA